MFKQIAALSAACLMAGTLAAQQPKATKAKSAAGKLVQRFAMNPLHVNIGAIESVKPDGTVAVKDLGNPRFILRRPVSGQNDLTEGRYLGFVGKDFAESTNDVRVVKLQVVRVRRGNKALVRVSATAAKHIKPGEDVLFFRPPGSTTAQLIAAPDFAPVDDGETTSPLGTGGATSRASLATSKNNLKQIGLAMHNFHDVYRRFPPAVIYGPDGKPWHSWRVLLLPFLEQQALYQQYRFDEPWNGPHNKKLAKLILAVYQDPAYGSQKDAYTNYAVITGKGTVFPSEGVKMTKKTDNPLELLAKSTGASRIADILDGTSNTILAGTVGPERKIPWSKPEDVVFGDKFPALGKKGSFATPYRLGGAPLGVFLFADGRVLTLKSTLDLNTLRNLMQRADGHPVSGFDSRSRRRSRTANAKPMQFVEIRKTKTGFTARLVGAED